MYKSRTSFFLLLMLTGLALHAQDYSSFECNVISEGKNLAYPFTGGFDAPQFSHCDFNLDGVLDLFVFDRHGDVTMVFEKGAGNGSTSYRFTREYDYAFPDSLRLFAKMKDFNGDGIYDLFVSPTFGPSSSIQLYQGQLDDQGNFEYVIRRMGNNAGSLDFIYYQNGAQSINVSASNIDIPEIVDVDNDGDQDILSYELGSSFYVRYYQNLQMDKGLPADTMDFVLGDNCFGKFQEGGLDATISLSDDPDECSVGFRDEKEEASTRGGGVHAGSTIMAYDPDMDGDQDLLIGDLNTNTLIALHNGGTPEKNWMTEVTPTFTDGTTDLIMPQFLSGYSVDVDGDGINDIIASPNNDNNTSNVDNIWLYTSQAGPQPHNFVQTDFLTEETIDLGSFTAPVFLDENADGLMDILVGSGGYFNPLDTPRMFMALYRNVGTATNPVYELADSDYLGISQFNDPNFRRPTPTVGDLDGDGDLDMLVSLNGFLLYYENSAGLGNPMSFGNPTAGPGGQSFMEINGGTNGRPAMADINGDGLTDIIIGEQSLNQDSSDPDRPVFGSVAYYQNTGSIGDPQFSGDLGLAPNHPTLGRMHTKLFLSNGLPVTSAPHFISCDGGLEVLLGSADGRIKRYAVDNDDVTQAYTLRDSIVGGILEGQNTVLSTADVDNDGFLEMIVGNGRGGLSFFNTDLACTVSSSEEIPDDHAEISLYPNPSQGLYKLSDPDGKVNSVEVYTSSGAYLGQSSDPDEIDLRTLPTGIYMAKIYLDASVITRKLVKL